jgi:hypothetical protein
VVVGHETVVAEEDDDLLRVRHRARGGGAVAAVERLFPVARGFSPPQLASVRPAEADRQELLAVARGQEDPVPHEHG